MVWNNISESLQKKGFVPSSKDSRTAEFLIKVTEDKKMYICSIIKNVMGTNITSDVIVESAEELQRKFLLGGYTDVSVMHIIVTDRDEDVKLLEEKGIQFWVVDVRSQRFMVFENQTENYFGIREVIEEALTSEDGNIQKLSFGERRINTFVPFVTAILVIINAIIFFVCQGTSPDAEMFMSKGVLGHEYIYVHKEYYRFITSMFLHFDFRHVATNMFMLAIVGSRVERWIGHIRFIMIYFISGFGAGIASVIYHMMIMENVVSAGASGAVYGIFGAMLVMIIKYQDEEFDLRQIFMVLILLVFGSIEEGVDVAAHIGGLVIGIVSALALSMGKGESEVEVG